jgi:KaiC/GvpD/RAD55 family RecA-like ATPase
MTDPYLAARGFTDATVERAGLRVEPIGERTKRYGLPPDAADANALVIPYRFKGRVSFERLRLIGDDVERFKGGKYRQPAGVGLRLYDPFNWLWRDEPIDSVLVVEGEANAVSVAQALPKMPVVGLAGHNALTDDAAQSLAHVPVVFLWFDLHEKGAARSLASTVRKLRAAGVEDVRIVEPTDDVDANDMLVSMARPAQAFSFLLDTATPAPLDDDDDDDDHQSRPKGPSFRWLDVADLHSREPEPVRWQVDGLAVKGALTMLAGQPGEGKSLLAMAVAAGVAMGDSIAGMFCRRGSVLIVDAEQSAGEIHRRVKALGMPADRVGIVQVDGVDLARDLREIRSAIRERRPDLVVLDSFRSMWAGEENDSAAAAAPLYALNRMAQREGVALVLLHHAGKGESPYRGSTAIAGAVEIGLTLSRAKDDEDPSRRYLDCWKCRPAVEPKRRWLRIADDRMRGLVFIEPAEAWENTGRPPLERAAVRDDVLRLLSVNPDGLSRPDLARGLGRAKNDGTVRRVLDALEIGGHIERFADGIATRYRVARKGCQHSGNPDVGNPTGNVVPLRRFGSSAALATDPDFSDDA